MDVVNFNFLYNNGKGLKTFIKCLKLFNYLKNKDFQMVFYSYSPQRRVKLSRNTNLTIIYTFHMANEIRVE